MLTKFEMNDVLARIAIAQRSAYLPVCPRCGQESMECFKDSKTFGALSRRADIYICSDCGTEEGAEDYYDHVRMLPISEWALFADTDNTDMNQDDNLGANASLQGVPVSTQGLISFNKNGSKMFFFGLHLTGSTNYAGQNFLRSVHAGAFNLAPSDIYLVRELDNQYDENAVQLWYRSNGKEVRLGFVDRKQNPIVANCLDNGGNIRILNHTIYGQADSYCGLFMDAQMEFPAPTQR